VSIPLPLSLTPLGSLAQKPATLEEAVERAVALRLEPERAALRQSYAAKEVRYRSGVHVVCCSTCVVGLMAARKVLPLTYHWRLHKITLRRSYFGALRSWRVGCPLFRPLPHLQPAARSDATAPSCFRKSTFRLFFPWLCLVHKAGVGETHLLKTETKDEAIAIEQAIMEHSV
jgi:hypothetical protein